MTHILIRGDTAANWFNESPTLMEREMGIETDTLKAKIGNGEDQWIDLPYLIQPIPDLALYATLASPTFTGNPQAPTKVVGDNSANIATTAFVKAQGYATVASPTLTGDPKAPTPATADNDTSIATTAFVKAQGYAPLASPALTGNPTSPTPALADNDTSIATTAFAQSLVGGGFARMVGPWPTTAPPNGTTGTAITITKPGTYLFTVSASGYAASGVPLALTWTHYLDGNPGITDVQYFNEANVHHTAVTFAFSAFVAAGTHYLYTRFSGASDLAGDRAIWTFVRIGI